MPRPILCTIHPEALRNNLMRNMKPNESHVFLFTSAVVAEGKSITAANFAIAAAQAVGVGEQSLRKWHARLAPKPEPCGENASLDELRVENQRLRRELRRAEMEREILKKATAYFAKESL